MAASNIVAAQPASLLAPTVALLPKNSISIPVAVPAATLLNGQVQPSQVQVTGSGTRFYVRVSSATIYLQPLRAGHVGNANPFNTGQGQTVSGGFETLTASNYNLFPVVALVWVGFEDFINDQLVLDNISNPQVVFPTYPTANAGTSISINDLSGTVFSDINGKKWNALFRVAILVFNLDSGLTAYLQKKGATTSGGLAAGVIYPAPLPIRFDFSGDYSINLGGAAINMIVSEIYSAFPSST